MFDILNYNDEGCNFIPGARVLLRVLGETFETDRVERPDDF